MTSRMKAPYNVLFSNDTTNIQCCVVSSFRTGNEPFRPEMLEATVDETAGVGIDVLEDGVNTVEITLVQNDKPCALVFLDAAVE